MAELRHIVHPFEPIIAPNCRVLILGSVPSVRSVSEGFYYMHPQNRFWPMLSRILNEDMTKLSFDKRRELLIKNNIGVYDSVYACDIEASSDARAKNIVPADIPAIIAKTAVQAIFANGALSYSTLIKYHPELKPNARKLPSTSAANAGYSMDKLIDAWSGLKSSASAALPCIY